MRILTCTVDVDLPLFPAILTVHRHTSDVVTSQLMETVTVVVIGIVVQCLQWAVHHTTGAHRPQPITRHHVPDLNTAEGLHLLAQWVTPSKLSSFYLKPPPGIRHFVVLISFPCPTFQWSI